MAYVHGRVGVKKLPARHLNKAGRERAYRNGQQDQQKAHEEFLRALLQLRTGPAIKKAIENYLSLA